MFLGVVRGRDTWPGPWPTTRLGVLAADPTLCVTPGDSSLPPAIPEADPARRAAAVVGLDPWKEEDEGLKSGGLQDGMRTPGATDEAS